MQVDPSEIIQIIKENDTQVDIDSLEPESDLREMGADSLDMMNIFLAIQEKYNVEVPDEEIENLPNVAAICNFLGEL